MRLCSRCGIRKVTTKRGKAVCTFCHASERKRRRCTECERDRKIPDEIRPLGRVCFACQREKELAYQRIYYERNKARIIERVARWRERHPEKAAEHQHTFWERLRSDPERHARVLQDKRIWNHINEERNGRQIEGRVRAVGRHEPPKTGNHAAPMLPVDPLVEWLRREYRDWSITELARYVGVNESSLMRIWNGDYKRVSLHVADQIFTGANCPHLLALYYPEP